MPRRLLLLSGLIAALGLCDAHAQSPPAQPGPAAGAVTLDTGDQGEPLPANAPKDPYFLAAWCYGALDQYLYIYEQIIPQLQAIDKEFGSSVKNEERPYASDMAAARKELKVLSGAVEAAEKASIRVIAPLGATEVREGRNIWSLAETGTRRQLADAWLSWALPDACDANARSLTSRSELLGAALKYNGPSATDVPPAPVVVKADEAPASTPPPPTPPTKAEAGKAKPAPRRASALRHAHAHAPRRAHVSPPAPAPDAPVTPASSDAKTDEALAAPTPEPAADAPHP